MTDSPMCLCCHGWGWFGCRCDETCETGRQRMAEGRDPTDVEGDAKPEPKEPQP